GAMRQAPRSRLCRGTRGRRARPEAPRLAPGHGARARALLVGARLRDPAALSVRGRRRDLQPRDVPALARTRAVARGLRLAVAAPQGRAIRRESPPLPAVLP